MEEKQIFFMTWGSQTDEHRNYFRDIEDIAHLIGAQMEADGVKVVQTKEKFGQPRVYVTLRSEDDRRYYRDAYLRVFRLFPWYITAIKCGADYPELVCETQEEFDELKNRSLNFADPLLTDELNSQYAAAREKHFEEAAKICGWKL